MAMYKDLHQFQMHILQTLLLSRHCKFTDFSIEGLSSDHLSYHVNKLLKEKLITKHEDGLYELTTIGKDFANRIDTSTSQIEDQGKRGVLIRCIRDSKGEKEWLFNKRLKQPLYGYIGFHTGKVKQGETIYEGAHRELKEETGLSAKFKLAAIFHYIDYDKNGNLLRDIYLYTFNGYDCMGKLIKDNSVEGVYNFWATAQEITGEDTYPDFWEKEDGLNWQYMPSNLSKDIDFKLYEKKRVIEEY
jgi:8-oxo-dGTP pyrophosphatase MutT (NUDIX family)